MAWLRKKCLDLLETLKRMLLVKVSGGGEKAMYCFPQMMQANDELALDLDTPSFHPAHTLRTLLCYCHNLTRPH